MDVLPPGHRAFVKAIRQGRIEVAPEAWGLRAREALAARAEGLDEAFMRMIVQDRSSSSYRTVLQEVRHLPGNEQGPVVEDERPVEILGVVDAALDLVAFSAGLAFSGR